MNHNIHCHAEGAFLPEEYRCCETRILRLRLRMTGKMRIRIQSILFFADFATSRHKK